MLASMLLSLKISSVPQSPIIFLYATGIFLVLLLRFFDNTPVVIKVLSAEAAQDRKHFQQEHCFIVSFGYLKWIWATRKTKTRRRIIVDIMY
ncbi:hypothetical protein PIB30_093346 [Stylosanthes scabra]|uniref:Uncharacterized protein n=1 Tax=Stylosanthes scabra TaxID=79078 RepID=A0ABU6RVN4_9FABA|nr:hypothetical protein [Stylosanthes scabra]